jgi:hypothetical protein
VSPSFAADSSNSSSKCGEKLESKDITIVRMKVHSLCGADPGSMDVVFEMTSNAKFKKFGLPASVSKKADVKAVTDKDVWVEVNKDFVAWPKKFMGHELDAMKVKVIEDDFIGDDTLGESDWVYWDKIPTDGSVLLVKGGESPDKDCQISEDDETLPNPSFEVELKGALKCVDPDIANAAPAGFKVFALYASVVLVYIASNHVV